MHLHMLTKLSIPASILALVFLIALSSSCALRNGLAPYERFLTDSESLKSTDRDRLSGAIPFDYAVDNPGKKPVQIYVNQVGYPAEGKKVLVISGVFDGTLDFEIISAKSKDVLFEGSISSSETSVYSIDFSTLMTEGEYMARVKGVGQSRTFVIDSHPYDVLIAKLSKKQREYFDRAFEYSEQKDFDNLPADAAFAVQFLLLLKTDPLPAQTILSGGQDAKDALVTMAEQIMAICENRGPTLSQRLLLVGTLSRIAAYLKNNTNTETSHIAEYIKNKSELYDPLAEDSGNFFDKNVGTVQAQSAGDTPLTYGLFAYSGLYSLYGDASQRQRLDEIFSITMRNSSYDRDIWYFFAEFEYLNSKNATDSDLCDRIIERWNTDVRYVQGSHSYLQAYMEEIGVSRSLLRGILLCVVDYLLSGSDYEAVLADIMDFYAGRNAQDINYAAQLVSDDNSALQMSAWENIACLYLLGKI